MEGLRLGWSGINSERWISYLESCRFQYTDALSTLLSFLPLPAGRFGLQSRRKGMANP